MASGDKEFGGREMVVKKISENIVGDQVASGNKFTSCVQSVLNNMAGVETCFLKLSEELN